ncbi:MAG: protoheme IX farnesyltransferase [Limnochordaceae bacterium]|nr:protoheme IX farnesyltransferase [Limnochordaceae bacterium]
MRAPALSAGAASGPWERVRQAVSDYYELTKPRIVALILITTLSGFLVAPGPYGPPALLLATLAGVGLVSGGGGVLNCYIDRDIDARMRRTARRAIPAGRIRPGAALLYGLGLTGAGLAILLAWVGKLPAALTFVGFSIYVGVYSLWLKRRTPQNIVLGGAAGAMGPVIGWAAAGQALGVAPWLLFAIIFLWTPPHFWSLALLAEEDYRRAGVPMLPNVRGAAATRRWVVAYTVALAAVAMLPPLAGVGGPLYLAVAGAAGVIYVAMAVQAWRQASREADRALFHYSLFYLSVVYTTLVISARWLA